MWAQLINVLLGLWLMAAPAVLGYGGPVALSDFIIGPIVVTLATVAVSESTRSVRWGNLPLGLWLIVAPWILGAALAPTVNGLVVGLALAGFGAVRGEVRQKFGGGWSALWGPGDPALRAPEGIEAQSVK